MTAATDNTRLHASLSRDSLRPTTSLTPSGGRVARSPSLVPRVRRAGRWRRSPSGGAASRSQRTDCPRCSRRRIWPVAVARRARPFRQPALRSSRRRARATTARVTLCSPRSALEHVGERMRPIELAFAVRGHDGEARRTGRAHDVAQEQQRGLVRPVEVIEDDQHRDAAGRCGQHRGDGFEESITLGLGLMAGGLSRSGMRRRSSGISAASSAPPPAAASCAP